MSDIEFRKFLILLIFVVFGIIFVFFVGLTFYKLGSNDGYDDGYEDGYNDGYINGFNGGVGYDKNWAVIEDHEILFYDDFNGTYFDKDKDIYCFKGYCENGSIINRSFADHVEKNIKDVLIKNESVAKLG